MYSIQANFTHGGVDHYPQIIATRDFVRNLYVGILSLPGLDAFTKKATPKHPGVGLRVTVSGAHPYSGYHGVIRDALGAEENHFSVELEAKYEKVIVEKKNLTLRS